jgi:drug/metabolite transporter (DMT)-like permease
LLSLSFGLAQALLVRAFSYAPTSLLAPFSCVQIIAATVFGMVVPELWTFFGIAFIIGAGVYVTQSRAA